MPVGIGDKKVDEYCEKKEIPILLKIPHDQHIAELYSNGIQSFYCKFVF